MIDYAKRLELLRFTGSAYPDPRPESGDGGWTVHRPVRRAIARIGVLVVLAIGCVVVFSGCLDWRGPHHPAVGSERDAIEAARAAWTAAGRPSLDAALCSIPVEIVIVEPPPAGRSPCVVLAPAERSWAPACNLYVTPYVGASPRLAVYLDAGLDEAGRSAGLVHEMLHHLGRCSGGPADQDPYHQDSERWGPIQAAALRRIRQ